MFKKAKNRILLILLVVLAGIVAAVMIYDSHTGERTFREELFVVDTAQVTSITIIPKGDHGNEITLALQSGGWDVSSQDNVYPADPDFIRNLLQTLAGVKPERVASLDREDWKDFDVTDSSGTHVVVRQGDDIRADFWVGRVSFSQQPQASAYGRNQNPSVKSHIRVEGDDKVYLVDGFLSLMFSNQPSRYRDRTICKFNSDQITMLTYSYPGDSSFILKKSGSVWLADDLPADSVEVVSLLRSLANTTGSEFAGEEKTQGLHYTYHLAIEGNSMPGIEIEGAKVDTAEVFFIRSSANPTAVFRYTNPSVFNRIFIPRNKF